MATSGAGGPPNARRNYRMKSPNSPPAENVSNAFVKLIGRLLLSAGIGLGWLLTKIGGRMFDAGANLETWARNKLKELTT